MKQLTTVAVGVTVATVLGVAGFTGHDAPERAAAVPPTPSGPVAGVIPPPVVEMSLREHHRVTRGKTRTVVKLVSKPKKKVTKFVAATHTISGRLMTKESAGNRLLGRAMAANKGWTGSEWYCLEDLWSRESQWSTSTGSPAAAYGIPQSLPGSKMSSEGPNWMTSARTQIKWGLGYIKGRYGSPCSAMAHFRAVTWY